ncbi:MAG: FHIPEP family type III secretion protein, partial [Armatimonadota bacterium]
EVGYGLISLADPKQGGDLLDRITAARRQVAIELGLVVPPVRVRDNMQLSPNEYVIRLRGSVVARGTLYPGQYLAMNPGTATSELPGQPTTEPAFGLPALWIPGSFRETAISGGYTVVDAMTVLITHLSEVFRKHAAELLSRQDVQAILDRVRVQFPALVDGVVPDQITLGEVHRVLRMLLRERVAIKDIPTILEALSDASAVTRDPVMLTEQVRSALARQITEQYREADGKLYAVVVDPRVERIILDRVRTTETGTVAAPDPHFVQRLVAEAGRLLEGSAALGREAVILCSTRVRPFLRSLLERPLPRSAVLSHSEIADDAQIEVVGTLRVDVPEETSATAGGDRQ